MKRWLLTIFVLLFFSLSLVMFRISRLLEQEIPPYGHIFLTDRFENAIALLPAKAWYSSAYTENIKAKLITNIIEIEDRRFFQHIGIDVLSKLWVLWESLWAGGFTRGGSTITEQYIKNRYFPGSPRTLVQKIRESLWAITAELKYRKEDILRNYLETVYMGNGIYGVNAAIEHYFQEKSVVNLDESAIVEIIVRLRYPNLWWNSETYKKQVSERLGLASDSTPIPSREKKTYFDKYPFLTERVRKEFDRYCDHLPSRLIDFVLEIPKDICNTPFIQLTTSIDSTLMDQTEDAIQGILYGLSEKNVENGAVYIWSESEKKVLTYVWNRKNAKESGIDMIVKDRSVGSVLKPFLYLIALHSHDANALILDEKKVYATEKEGIAYIPENYIPRAYGPITLKSALGNSLNSAAVRLTESLWVSRVYASLRSIWFDLNQDVWHYGYGITLWSVEMSVEKVVEWYRTLTNLWDKENFLLFDILSDSKNRSLTFGASSILNTSLPVAVKTWTSSEFRDNWAIGYTDEVIIGVWVWNTDRSSMDDVSWVTWAWPIFHQVAEALIAKGYITPKEREVPVWIIESALCLDDLCNQKELTYMKVGYERKSRPASKTYYESDFITPLSSEEKVKWKIR